MKGSKVPGVAFSRTGTAYRPYTRGASTRLVWQCRINALQTMQKNSKEVGLGLRTSCRRKNPYKKKSYGTRIFNESPVRLVLRFSREFWNLWKPGFMLISLCDFYRGIKEFAKHEKYRILLLNGKGFSMPPNEVTSDVRAGRVNPAPANRLSGCPPSFYIRALRGPIPGSSVRRMLVALFMHRT